MLQILDVPDFVSISDIVFSLYSKAIAGDVTACIFWLKNRRPREWRDVQHLDQAVLVRAVIHSSSVIGLSDIM